MVFKLHLYALSQYCEILAYLRCHQIWGNSIADISVNLFIFIPDTKVCVYKVGGCTREKNAFGVTKI